jgi:NADPH-dependent 2,4-dienoyl-CoA reductase/sulfur reductase-like enzyme
MTVPQCCDLAIVGAGPAGLAAATTAAGLGLDVVLLDEQAAPGGQIYRAITHTPLATRDVLGKDYWRGEALLEPFRNCGARYLPGATVWAAAPVSTARSALVSDSASPAVSPVMSASGPRAGAVVSRDAPPWELAYSVGGAANLLHARHVLLATGAQERPFPIPGWTLPGVLGAGAAQIMLKSAGMAPESPAVLAGSGPLLYLLAWQYLNAGAPVAVLLDTTPAANARAALPHAWGFLRSPYLAKGWKLLREVRAAIPVVKRVTGLRAEGQGRLESVRYRVGATERVQPARHLLLHQGVIPGLNLARAMGMACDWNDRLACWEPVVDRWGATSLDGVSLAGDGGGIAGALAAEQGGRIAAWHAAHVLGRITAEQRDAGAAQAVRAHARATRGRAFFDTLYRPAPAFRRPAGDTIVCRCEEVTAQQVRDTVQLGCTGVNQMKAFLRCGMGPCQGRFCGATVTELIAQERGVHPREVGYYRLRFPTKPITLGEFASLPQTEASRKAVVRFGK